MYKVYTKGYYSDMTTYNIPLKEFTKIEDVKEYVINPIKNPKHPELKGNIPSQAMCDAMDKAYGRPVIWEFYYYRVIFGYPLWIDFGSHSIFLYIEGDTANENVDIENLFKN